ncbi:hypothetical protein ACQ4PT_007656 [Festuca glaucescens]
MEVMEPALPPVVPAIPSQSPPPRMPVRPPPPRTSEDRFSAEGGVIAGIVLGFVASLLVLTVLYSLYKGRRDSRARARAGAAAWAAAARAPLDPGIGHDDGRQSRRASASSPTDRQPAFAYGPPAKNTETGGGEEAATCSVCLGALQLGETVRLLPACLHLFHVECIDPWLDAHSTCPICRSDTDPSIDVSRLPPV